MKGCGFESQQEWRENFLLQGQRSVLYLILVSVPPLCYRSSTEKILIVLPKAVGSDFTVTFVLTDFLNNVFLEEAHKPCVLLL